MTSYITRLEFFLCILLLVRRGVIGGTSYVDISGCIWVNIDYIHAYWTCRHVYCGTGKCFVNKGIIFLLYIFQFSVQ